jgi:hypothetical protein
LPTVDFVHPNRAGISLLATPSAAANTILDRSASACALFDRRAHRSSTSRSSEPQDNLSTLRHRNLHRR